MTTDEPEPQILVDLRELAEDVQLEGISRTRRGDPGPRALSDAIEAIIARHEPELRRMAQQAAAWVQCTTKVSPADGSVIAAKEGGNG